MKEEMRQPCDGSERRKHNLVVLPGKRDIAEPPADKTAPVEDAIQSLLEVKGNIGRVLILFESLDGKHFGCVDSDLPAEKALMMVELFKRRLLNS
jgi:hypothetical protein